MSEESKQTMKDRVFAVLFNSREHLADVFNTLFPDNGPVTGEEVNTIDMEVYLSAEHFDAGFLVRDSRMILVETQSVFSMNYATRILISLPELLNNYLRAHGQSMYSRKRLHFPTPSFFIIYTGQEDVPSSFLLSELFENSSDRASRSGVLESEACVELQVNVVRKSGTDGILNQYIRFCQIADEMRDKFGDSDEADKETVKKCMEEGILTDVLASLDGG